MGDKAENHGVFISHTIDESQAAQKLKSLLRQTFGRDLDVFVSSDYRSIPGGDNWFETIVGTLKRAHVVIVLLSKYSLYRPWINFEAGVGLGAEARVIPTVFRSLKKSDVQPPLSLLQLRDIHVLKDLGGLLDDIANALGKNKSQQDLELFLEEFSQIEAALPSHGINIVPSLEYSGSNTYLHFRLESTTTMDVELLEVWATIPEAIKDNSSFMPMGSEGLRVHYDYDPNTITKKYFAGRNVSGPDFRTDYEILPPLMTPGMFPLKMKEMRFSLKSSIQGNEKIFYGLHAKGMTIKHEIFLREVEGFR